MWIQIHLRSRCTNIYFGSAELKHRNKFAQRLFELIELSIRCDLSVQWSMKLSAHRLVSTKHSIEIRVTSQRTVLSTFHWSIDWDVKQWDRTWEYNNHNIKWSIVDCWSNNFRNGEFTKKKKKNRHIWNQIHTVNMLTAAILREFLFFVSLFLLSLNFIDNL